MRFLPSTVRPSWWSWPICSRPWCCWHRCRPSPLRACRNWCPPRTILVYFEPHRITVARLVNAIAGRDLQGSVQRSEVLVQIPVRYDGEDLAEVAQILGISAEEVVRRHTGSEWSVAFTGFAPGFAYLSGGDAIFNVPRRATPRKVPAGAVALAGSFSAVYPQASPGGWQIIGVTDTAMWDLSRDLPALLQPGYRVRFVDAGALKT